MSDVNTDKAIKKQAREIAAGQVAFAARDAIDLQRFKNMIPVFIPLTVKVLQAPVRWNRWGGEDSAIKDNVLIVQVLDGPKKDEFMSVNVNGKTFEKGSILPKTGDIMDLLYEAYQDPNAHVSKCVLRSEPKK